MKMKKINLRNYSVKGIDADGKDVELPYDVKESISMVIFSPTLKLDGRSLLKRGKLAEKIEAAKDEILLEDADYTIVQTSFAQVTGYGKNDLELVKRVLEAEDIEVKEKGK